MTLFFPRTGKPMRWAVKFNIHFIDQEKTELLWRRTVRSKRHKKQMPDVIPVYRVQVLIPISNTGRPANPPNLCKSYDGSFKLSSATHFSQQPEKAFHFSPQEKQIHTHKKKKEYSERSNEICCCFHTAHQSTCTLTRSKCNHVQITCNTESLLSAMSHVQQRGNSGTIQLKLDCFSYCFITFLWGKCHGKIFLDSV